MIALLKHAYRVVHSSVRELTKPRSPKWREAEKVHLAQYSSCAACGGNTRLQVHHEKPFHLDPQLELDPKNLVTLCMGPFECHLRIGHGDFFKAYNPNVRADAQTVLLEPARRNEIEAKAKTARLLTDGGAS